MLKAIESNESLAKTYSMSLIEIELSIKNKEAEVHSYHPELEKKIQELGNIMKKKEESECLTVETYLDSIFEKKLIEFGEAQVKREIEMFESNLKEAFIKEEKRLLSSPHPQRLSVRKEEFTDTIIEGCKSLKRGDQVGKNVFSSLMLYDAYTFAISKQTPLDFLTYIHCTHAIKGNTAQAVNAYVVSKCYSMQKLEKYENRFMFAELYHYVRAGLYTEAQRFLEENKNFFWLISNNFYSSFMYWMQTLGFIREERKYSMEWEEVPTEKDDAFKLFFYRVFTGSTECIKSIVTTIEDFLWYQIIIQKTVSSLCLKKKAYTDLEIFKLLEGSISAPRLLQSSLILRQWKHAMNILQDETFKAGESLFLSYAISQKNREENPRQYPVKRERSSAEPAECINLFVRAIQGVTTLFAKPEDKLCIVNTVSSFISAEWLEDLVAEVFISSEDYSVLGNIDNEGRRHPSTMQEYVEVSENSVIQRISEYYTHCGELEKALKVSYIGGSENTLEILKSILVEKIQTKDYAASSLEQMVKYFNNPLVNFLWQVLCIGGSTENSIPLIRRTGLIPENNPASMLKKLNEISSLSTAIKGVIPTALVIMSKRLGEHPHKENQDLAKSLLLFAGALEMDKEVLYEIVSAISPLL
ncbi:hypothetical protein NEMIN01_2295 [Nematocida minor]|uniref:uncharacterized protein n=1 Tax=Nematocida minor TaxID=1912983 RepID=UPI00221E7B98|nr:uncharacterized protein NEMIN01_2295 [Nematocida minor]KAI5192931.1 hypothetical protein NEMIN01_2295 [Nematocida minor]